MLRFAGFGGAGISIDAEVDLLREKKKAIVMSILAMLLWGSAIPLIKCTFVELGIGKTDTGLKIWVAGIRFLLAGFLTMVYFKVSEKGRRIAFKKVNWKFVVILADPNVPSIHFLLCGPFPRGRREILDYSIHQCLSRGVDLGGSPA